MARQTIQYTLEGEVSLADFRKGIAAFTDLVEQLTEQASAETDKVEWVIKDLRGGSATVEIGPASSRTQEGLEVAEEVVVEVEEIGRRAALSNYSEWYEYPRPIRDSVYSMFSMLNGRIPRARLGDAVILAPVTVERPDNDPPPVRRQRTSVRGKIVTLDNKRNTYFTLKEAFTNRLIRCWPDPTYRAQIAKCWESQEWVLVEGHFNTFTQKPTLTDITEIWPFGPGDKSGWRGIFGISPRKPGDSTDSVNEIVRKVRNGE